MSEPPVEFSGVSVGGSLIGPPLIPDIHWRVRAGDFWVVTGPQESGKSTLLQTAAGLRPPLAGSVLWWGAPAPEGEAAMVAWRRRLGLVFDRDGRLFRSLTVAENIALPVAYHGNLSMAAATEVVGPLIRACGLEFQAGWMPSRLSRSAARLTGIARALALKPELLLVDEPSAGVDELHARVARDLLAALAAGHPWLDHRPLTLVVTAPTVRPWVGFARQFAVARSDAWRAYADAPAMLAAEDASGSGADVPHSDE